MRGLAAVLVVLWAQGAVAETGGFSRQLDGVCSLGRDLEAGCPAIRARPILDAADPVWRPVGRVNFAGARTRLHCTGTLVADDLVLTAAHCLFDAGEGQWVLPAQVTFVAGYQRGEFAASARGVSYMIGAGEAARQQAFQKDPATDWALLRLDQPIGRDVGVLLLADDLDPTDTVRVAGYAGLRPHVLSQGACGPMGLQRSGIYVLGCPAMPGDSGAPVLVGEGDEMRVVGILSSLVPLEGAIVSLAIPADSFAATVDSDAMP